MPNTFVLDVVKPDGRVLSTEVEECIVPGDAGYFGVRPGHTPFIAEIGIGHIIYRTSAGERYLMVDGGFCEVRADRVTVLAEHAELAEEIDADAAENAKRAAQAHLQKVGWQAPMNEVEETQRELRRADTLLEVASKKRA